MGQNLENPGSLTSTQYTLLVSATFRAPCHPQAAALLAAETEAAALLAAVDDVSEAAVVEKPPSWRCSEAQCYGTCW